MKKFFIVVLSFIVATSLYAEQSSHAEKNQPRRLDAETKLSQLNIDRLLVNQLISVSNNLAQVANEHPELAQFLQKNYDSDESLALKKLKGMTYYPEIVKALSNSKFTSLVQVLNVSKRLIAMIFFMESGQQAATKNLDAMLEILTSNYERMKLSPFNADKLQRLENDYTYQKQKYEGLKQALKLLDVKDKRFAQLNHQWLKQTFSQK